MMADDKPPDCYGVLNQVFPVDEDNGLRTTPVKCFDCPYKTNCLREAMNEKDGLKAKEEMVDRAFESGLLGFFQRWSQKKAIHRQIQLREKSQAK